jgi:hypothetical protein
VLNVFAWNRKKILYRPCFKKQQNKKERKRTMERLARMVAAALIIVVGGMFFSSPSFSANANGALNTAKKSKCLADDSGNKIEWYSYPGDNDYVVGFYGEFKEMPKDGEVELFVNGTKVASFRVTSVKVNDDIAQVTPIIEINAGSPTVNGEFRVKATGFIQAEVGTVLKNGEVFSSFLGIEVSSLYFYLLETRENTEEGMVAVKFGAWPLFDSDISSIRNVSVKIGENSYKTRLRQKRSGEYSTKWVIIGSEIQGQCLPVEFSYDSGSSATEICF